MTAMDCVAEPTARAGGCTCPPYVLRWGGADISSMTHVEVVTTGMTRWKPPSAESPRRFAYAHPQSVDRVLKGFCVLGSHAHDDRRDHPLRIALPADMRLEVEAGCADEPLDRWAICPECWIFQRVVTP